MLCIFAVVDRDASRGLISGREERDHLGKPFVDTVPGRGTRYGGGRRPVAEGV